MKLIVTIPAYNEEKTIASVISEIPRKIPNIDEVKVLVLDDGSKDETVKQAQKAGADFIISHKENKGLALTFKDALEEALIRGADIIVNTDADNHYDQSRIPELIQPILRKEADIVIGGREIKKLKGMPLANKYGNLFGSFLVRKMIGLPKIDVSSGFRAYSKEAAMKLNVLSPHTYTHETLINAFDQKLVIKEVPILARKVERPSRLISSIPNHIAKAGIVILRSFAVYKPLRVFFTIGGLLFLIGLIPFIRFLYFYLTQGGRGHIQSLIAGSVLIFLGFETLITGLVASAIGWNRKMIEEILYKLRKKETKE